ncbi:MAG: mechanosensitive ion channel [Planctomycetes bacterium]|nr:mechanosensitive ion channel [Planctomycetota bacterium]
MVRRMLPIGRLSALVVVGAMVGGAVAVGQPVPAPTSQGVGAPRPVAIDEVDKRLAELEAAPIEESVRAKAREFYQQARSELEQDAAARGQLAGYRERAASAAARLARQHQFEIRGDMGEFPVMPPDHAELDVFAAALSEHEGELKRVEDLVKRAETESPRRASRRLEIPRQVAAFRERLVEVESRLGEPPDPAEPAPAASARQMLLAARRQSHASQIESLLAELDAYDAEKDLPNRERARYRARMTRIAQSVERLRTTLDARRNDEVEARYEEARERAAKALPANADQARTNLKLAGQTRQTARDIAAAGNAITALHREASDWSGRIERSKRRVEKGASASSVAALRQDRINAAARVERLDREIRDRDGTIRALQDDMLETQDLTDEYAEIDAIVAKIARERAFALSPEEEPALRKDLRELLVAHRQLLDDSATRADQHFENLLELNDASDDLRRELRSYLAFIDARILWMRSADAVSYATLREAAAAIAPADFERWLDAVRRVGLSLRDEAMDHPLLAAAFLLVLLAALRYQRPLRAILVHLGDVAAKGNCVRFLPSLEAVVVTLLLALPWALVTAFLGWRLAWNGHAAGSGLLLTATVFLPIELFRQACRSKGLCESHYGWSDRILAPLRTRLRWYVLVATPFILISASFHSVDDSEYDDSVGRIAFLAWMALTTWAARGVIRPRGGVFHDYLTFHAAGWADRLAVIWYPAACGIPLALGVVAGIGFYHSAWDLAIRLFRTIAIVMLAITAGGLLHRLLLVSRRRLAMLRAREWRLRVQAAAGIEEKARTPQEPRVDLAAINQQTRRLIQSLVWLAALSAVWMIWRDVMPALAIFTEVELYRTEGVVAGVMQGVKLKHVGFALVVLIMTSVAARNIPGLLEIVLLQKLPLDSAVRYAITTISRYVLVLTGLIMASSALGISWRRVQWLVAALGVGLGFGLQEIFANLVSGVILLFERPIRVGDVVTLGDVTGTVTRIRIRATTVRDWDGKELIVPNKELITGRLLNWTLSDTTNRILVSVGVAYGSDVARACELILEAVAEYPAILADPAPTVTFESFGESCLTLNLRAFLPQLEQRLPCVHFLHSAIDRKFRANRIDIAFPQLDVHIKDAARLDLGRMSIAR